MPIIPSWNCICKQHYCSYLQSKGARTGELRNALLATDWSIMTLRVLKTALHETNKEARQWTLEINVSGFPDDGLVPAVLLRRSGAERFHGGEMPGSRCS